MRAGWKKSYLVLLIVPPGKEVLQHREEGFEKHQQSACGTEAPDMKVGERESLSFGSQMPGVDLL